MSVTSGDLVVHRVEDPRHPGAPKVERHGIVISVDPVHDEHDGHVRDEAVVAWFDSVSHPIPVDELADPADPVDDDTDDA